MLIFENNGSEDAEYSEEADDDKKSVNFNSQLTKIKSVQLSPQPCPPRPDGQWGDVLPDPAQQSPAEKAEQTLPGRPGPGPQDPGAGATGCCWGGQRHLLQSCGLEV